MVMSILMVIKETRCCHMGYSFQLAARVLLYASSHRQDNTLVTPVVEHWMEQEIAQWVLVWNEFCLLSITTTTRTTTDYYYYYYYNFMY